jgi:amidase
MALRDELAFMDATAQAALARDGQVTTAELVEAAIERAERVNPALNAIVRPMYDEARRDLAAVSRGPFAGVPFLLKDLLAAYAGVPMTSGSPFLSDFVPPFDSELVTRLKRAGLVCIGKTNTPEFGILPTTEPRLFGPARNPWDPGRTTGGSSGGSAAAVAAGVVPMAHANDGGGSIRIPAACCGVFGLKPTRARNSLGPMVGDIMSGLVVEHAVTRSVRDSAALLDATAGAAPGDPYWAPPPARPFLEEVGADPGRLRVAFTTKALTGTPVHQDSVEAALDAARLCEELGHDVVEASPEINPDMLIQTFLAVWVAGTAWTIDAIGRATGRSPSPDYFEPLTWAVYGTGRQELASNYLLSVQYLQAVSRDVARFFMEYDVWLTPALAEPPVPLGTFESAEGDPLGGLMRAVTFTPFTALFNATGQPAMSVPLSWNAEGLPIGVQFAGRFGDEATLFRLAAQLEAARPWAHRRPNVEGGAA